MEILKIYGDAPETVSVSTVTFSAPEIDGSGSIEAGLDSIIYVNFKLLLGSTLCTLVDILYLESLTPEILIGVP